MATDVGKITAYGAWKGPFLWKNWRNLTCKMGEENVMSPFVKLGVIVSCRQNTESYKRNQTYD